MDPDVCLSNQHILCLEMDRGPDFPLWFDGKSSTGPPTAHPNDSCYHSTAKFACGVEHSKSWLSPTYLPCHLCPAVRVHSPWLTLWHLRETVLQTEQCLSLCLPCKANDKQTNIGWVSECVATKTSNDVKLTLAANYSPWKSSSSTWQGSAGHPICRASTPWPL